MGKITSNVQASNSREPTPLDELATSDIYKKVAWSLAFLPQLWKTNNRQREGRAIETSGEKTKTCLTSSTRSFQGHLCHREQREHGHLCHRSYGFTSGQETKHVSLLPPVLFKDTYGFTKRTRLERFRPNGVFGPAPASLRWDLGCSTDPRCGNSPPTEKVIYIYIYI